MWTNDFLNPTSCISTTCSFFHCISFTDFHEAHSVIKKKLHRDPSSLLPHKNTARIWPFMRKQALTRHQNLMAQWFWTSKRPELWEMQIFVVINHQVYGIFVISSPCGLKRWCSRQDSSCVFTVCNSKTKMIANHSERWQCNISTQEQKVTEFLFYVCFLITQFLNVGIDSWLKNPILKPNRAQSHFTQGLGFRDSM